MKLNELFGDKGGEQIWRDNPGSKKLWVKSRKGRKYGPFSNTDNANKFLSMRKDIGPADVVVEGIKKGEVYFAPTNKYSVGWGRADLVKGYDPKKGRVKGGGITSGDFTKEDVKEAFAEVKDSTEFKEASDMMKFNSSSKELANGTLSWDASKSDKVLVVKVYPSGQIRKHTGPGGVFGDEERLFQVKSPKPSVVPGEVVKSLVKTYKKAIKAAIEHVKTRK